MMLSQFKYISLTITLFVMFQLFYILISANVVKEKSVDFKDVNNDFVECYYSKNTKEKLKIFDNFEGDVMKELPLLEKNYWYKLAIKESKKGWFQIANISIIPSGEEGKVFSEKSKFNNKWVNTNLLNIDIADMKTTPDNGVWFFKQPNLKSKIIYKSGKFLKTNLIAISGNWAKVKFSVDGNEYIGWLNKKDQCPYPWTSCPKTSTYNN